jgi:hypothetical protein
MNHPPELSVPSTEVAASLSQRRAALDRVLQSRYFEKAPLLSAFLSYVCEAALDNDTGRVTEQAIGVRVFRRPERYDPGEDNIVRNYARQLRRRLEVYYQTEGLHDAVRIDVPKGAYVAIFRSPTAEEKLGGTPVRSLAAVAGALSQAPEEGRRSDSEVAGATVVREAGSKSSFRPRFWLFVGFSILLCVLTGSALYRLIKGPPRSPIHPLWAEIFRSDRNTVVVPADVGFVILQQLNNRTFSLAEYEGWPAVEQYDHVYMSFLKAQKYTSMMDLDTVSRLERLPEVVPNRLFTRASRNLSMDDLSNDNVILLGSNFSNPWVEVFERSLTFHFVNKPQEGRSWIVNTKPVQGEAVTYENTTRNITHETYAVIAFLPNLAKSGHVLIVEGLDGPGTQAAVDLLFQGDQLSHVLKQATRPEGALGSFEVLLAATSLDTRATGVRIIAERYYLG